MLTSNVHEHVTLDGVWILCVNVFRYIENTIKNETTKYPVGKPENRKQYSNLTRRVSEKVDKEMNKK